MFAASVQYIHTLSSCISCYFCTTLLLNNSLGDSARELFKPSRDAASLLVYNEKIWGFGILVGDVISGEGFRPFCLRLPGPGP